MTAKALDLIEAAIGYEALPISVIAESAGMQLNYCRAVIKKLDAQGKLLKVVRYPDQARNSMVPLIASRLRVINLLNGATPEAVLKSYSDATSRPVHDLRWLELETLQGWAAGATPVWSIPDSLIKKRLVDTQGRCSITDEGRRTERYYWASYLMNEGVKSLLGSGIKLVKDLDLV